MEGWIKAYRMLIKKPIWLNSTPEQKVVLIALLLMVNYEENEWDWNGTKFNVLPGQCVTSLEAIKQASGKGLTLAHIRGALRRFQKLGFLTSKSTNQGRLITITNWSTYQCEEGVTKQANSQAPRKHLTTNKKGNNERRDSIADEFELFRTQYPGTKRGLDTELKNFLAKNDAEIVALLLPALNCEIAYRQHEESEKRFVAPWKNLSTWINNKCWEQEFPPLDKQTNNTTQIDFLPAKGMER